MTDTPPLPDFDLYGFTPYRLAVAAKHTSEQLARQYRDRFGISIPEWRVLVHLAHSGNTSVRDIEARVAMEKYEVSRAAKRLREAGLIERKENPEDRRLIILSLTTDGRKMMAELLPMAKAHQAELEKRLGDAFKQLEAGLEALLNEAK
jgi:DNA-binding MarR family transcriptional regulator